MKVNWDWNEPSFRFTSSELQTLAVALHAMNTPEAQDMAVEIEDTIDSYLARSETEDERKDHGYVRSTRLS